VDLTANNLTDTDKQNSTGTIHDINTIEKATESVLFGEALDQVYSSCRTAIN